MLGLWMVLLLGAGSAQALCPTLIGSYRGFIAENEVFLSRHHDGLQKSGAQGRWGMDGRLHPHSGSLDSDFLKFFYPHGDLESALRQHSFDRLKHRGRMTHYLDLFGSGHFVTDLEYVQSVTGIRAAEAELHLPPDPWLKRRVLTGNLYHSDTWRDLRRNMHERKIDCFDFITVRPFGGTMPTTTSGYLVAQAILLRRILSVACYDSSTLLLEIHGDRENHIRDWLMDLIDRSAPRSSSEAVYFHPKAYIDGRISLLLDLHGTTKNDARRLVRIP